MVHYDETDSEVNPVGVVADVINDAVIDAEVINDYEDAGTEMPTVNKQNLGNTSGNTDEIVLASATRDELLEEAVKLREKVKALQALAPKANLVTQNNNLISKNRKLVESVEMKNIEILNLKPIKEKFLQLSKKLGNPKHMELRANTKLEITNYVGNALNKAYGDISKMHFSEIELVLLTQLLFLDLSGGNQYQLFSKLLSVSSQGIRRCVQSKLKSIIQDAEKESKVIVVNEEHDAQAQAVNEMTPGNVEGVQRILSKRYKVVTAPIKYDARFDSFDQSRYLTEFNENCKFIRHTHVTYIATNPRRRCLHKFAGQKTCMLPGCKAIFSMDVTPIGPVVVVSPEYHPYYDTEIWVCEGHVLKSMEEGIADDVIFEVAAVEAEASGSVSRQLFQDDNRIYFSEDEDDVKQLTNTIDDAVEEDELKANEAAPTQTKPKETAAPTQTETKETASTEQTVSDADILDASTEDGGNDDDSQDGVKT